MGLLTKEQLLERRERAIKKVPLPWLDKKDSDDNHVLIQSLKAIEISRWRKSLLDKDGKPDPKQIERQRERLIVMALVDESGTRILDAGDLEALNQMDNSVIDAIFSSIEEMNGAKFDLPSTEETAGNSKRTAENTPPAE